MYVVAFSSTFTNPCCGSSLTRVEFPIVKSMNWNVEYAGIFIQYLGSTISYVNIPVKNANFLRSVLLLCNTGCNSHIIVEAESGNLIKMRMMSRWSNNGKSLVDQSLRADISDCLHSATCRETSRSTGIFVHVGINLGRGEILSFLLASTIFLYVLYMHRFVSQLEILIDSFLWIDLYQLWIQIFLH